LKIYNEPRGTGWFWAETKENFNNTLEELECDGGANFYGLNIVEVFYLNGYGVRDTHRQSIERNPPLNFPAEDYKYFIGPIEKPMDLVMDEIYEKELNYREEIGKL
jgi:hypothetical protein